MRAKNSAAGLVRGRAFWFFVLVLLVSLTCHSRLFSAAPTLEHFYPVAVQIGTSTTITAVGKFDPWPPKIWLDAPGVSFSAETKSGKFRVEVDANAALGPRLIRAFNDQGASAPRVLIVTANQEGTEKEPNDEFAKAPLLEHLPVTFNARLDKSGDVDCYGVKLEAGQTVIAWLEAHVLGSPMDAVLRLVDARGLEMALNHDDGRTLDPFLAWTAKVAGTYVLQVFGFAYPATADVKFTGGDACVYRLHVSRGPHVQYTIPLGIQRAERAKLRVFGWNLGTVSGREWGVDGSACLMDASEMIWRTPEFENTFILPLGDGPELVERALKTGGGDPAALVPPFAITGCIENTGEEDRYGFIAKKDERLLLEIQSASLGFPLDARLGIQDASGKELAKNDDSSTADPVLEWTPSADGAFVAVVGSVLHRSGPDHLYRLSIQRSQPKLKAVVADSGFTIEPGKTITIKVTPERLHGFKSRLTASGTELPEGLTVSPVTIGETEKEIALKVTASAEAKPFSGPIEIVLREEKADAVQHARHEMGAISSKNGVPRKFQNLVIQSTDKIWLTVLPASDPAHVK